MCKISPQKSRKIISQITGAIDHWFLLIWVDPTVVSPGAIGWRDSRGYFVHIGVCFALPLQGIVATSGVISIVVGLALQNTLGNVFSGLSLSVGKPYEVGEAVLLEGGVEGEVQVPRAVLACKSKIAHGILRKICSASEPQASRVNQLK
jgi:hypothetical protein